MSQGIFAAFLVPVRYRAIYDADKTPRSDVDHSLSPPPRSSVRTACARTQAHPSPASPAPVIWQMDTS